jgi:hypothetical protein
MQYSRAQKYTDPSPCTNIPLSCPLCSSGELGPQTFWKYNFVYHMATLHLDDEGNTPPISFELLKSIHITKAEELKMGIQAEKTKEYRDEYGIMDSSPMKAFEATGAMYNSLFKPRKRAASNVSASSAGSASRQPPVQKIARFGA